MVLCPGPRPGATCVLPVRSLSPQGAGPERPLFGHQGLLSRKLLIPRARRAVRELSTELHSRSSTLRAQRCPPPQPHYFWGTRGATSRPTSHVLPLPSRSTEPETTSGCSRCDAAGCACLPSDPAPPTQHPVPRSHAAPRPRAGPSAPRMTRRKCNTTSKRPEAGTPGSPAPPRGHYTPKADGRDAGALPQAPPLRPGHSDSAARCCGVQGAPWP